MEVTIVGIIRHLGLIYSDDSENLQLIGWTNSPDREKIRQRLRLRTQQNILALMFRDV
jgi:hypothetical protein